MEISRENKECVCDTTFTQENKCVICHVEKIQIFTKHMVQCMICPVHTVPMICGKPEFVCRECGDKGWYSTAGWGGATFHINSITGANINPRKKRE